MKTQTILDKFETISTTLHVLKKEDGGYFTLNEFGVVPVKCNIEYYWEPGMPVQDKFYVDTVTLDEMDDCITFELSKSIKEMIYPDNIISLNITKISEHEYFKAIREDKKNFDCFD